MQKSVQIVDLDNWFGGSSPFNLFNLPGSGPEDTFLTYARALFMVIMVILAVIWVIVALLSAIKIVSSGGSSDKLQEGFKGLRNLLIGITVLFLFFLVLSMIASVFII